jgi:hypothetical protein
MEMALDVETIENKKNSLRSHIRLRKFQPLSTQRFLPESNNAIVARGDERVA